MQQILEVLRRIARGRKHVRYAWEFLTVWQIFRRPIMMIAGYLGFPITYPFLCVTKTGSTFSLLNQMDLITAWVIYVRHEYYVCPTDNIILDCGANIGIFSVFAANVAKSAKIYAIEPFPETFRRLLYTVTLNNLAERVVCLNVALARENGNVYMETSTTLPCQSRHVVDCPDETAIMVKAVSLSSLLKTINCSSADLLKMDIEGTEHTVLNSTRICDIARFRRIAIEYHHTGIKTKLFNRFQAAGFSLRHDRVLGDNYGVADFVRGLRGVGGGH